MNITRFSRYVAARLEQEDRETSYRFYVSESVNLAPQNKFLTVSLRDIYENKIDNRTVDEIIEDTVTSAGLIMGDDI